MKRTYRFAKPFGSVDCLLPNDKYVRLPLFMGILKHPSAADLPLLLGDARSAKKYTTEALRVAAWQILREFPRDWLRECLPAASLSESRRRALEFLLGRD